MEQMPSNMPVMETKPGVAGWFQVWMTAATKPNEQTYVDLTEQPGAASKIAFLWVFIAGTISGILQAILQAVYTATGTMPQIPGLEQFTQNLGGDAGNIGITLVTGICLSPVAGAVSVLFFAIIVAIVQWIAKLFGGVGTFEKLAYAFAAITVPFTLVSSVLALLSAIPFVGLCFSILSIGISLYVIVLQVMAVKGVNRFGWGAAVGSVFIPWLVVGLFCCCLVFGLVAMLGPVMGDVFQGLPITP
jgi:hypothetical protein